MRPWVVVCFSALAMACDPSVPPRPPKLEPLRPTPSASAAAVPPPALDLFAIPAALMEEDLSAEEPGIDITKLVLPPLKQRALAGVKSANGDPSTSAYEIPPQPAACRAFTSRAPQPPEQPCTDGAALRVALAGALQAPDHEKRDAQLAGLEACSAAPPGLIRALRAEFAPRECADALAEPALSSSPAPSPRVFAVLFALSLAGRLQRSVPLPPKAPRSRPALVRFAEGPFRTWVQRTASAITACERAATALSGYAGAVAQAEAALARYRMRDRTLVMTFMAVNDGEDLSPLTAVLRPAVDRARASATAALRAYAMLGSVEDERLRDVASTIDRHRVNEMSDAFLVKTYQHARRPLPPDVTDDNTLLHDLERYRRASNGLGVADYLRLPARAVPSPASPEARLAATLPTFYAGILLDPALAGDDALMPCLASRGIPVSFRRALRGADLRPATLRALVRFRFDLIQYLLRPADIDEAIALSARWRKAASAAEQEGEEEEEAAAFYLATALSLRGEGKDGEDLFPGPPLPARPAALTMGDVAPLKAFLSRFPPSPLADLVRWNAAAFFERFVWTHNEGSFYLEAARRYREAGERIQTRELAFDCERRAGVMDGFRKANL